jgi:hypothetical protein
MHGLQKARQEGGSHDSLVFRERIENREHPPSRIVMAEEEFLTGLFPNKTVGNDLREPAARKDLPRHASDLKVSAQWACHHARHGMGGRNLVITFKAGHLLHEVLRSLEVHPKRWGNDLKLIFVQRLHL